MTINPGHEKLTHEFTVSIQPTLPKEWSMVPHRHIQFEIALVRNGKCVITFLKEPAYCRPTSNQVISAHHENEGRQFARDNVSEFTGERRSLQRGNAFFIPSGFPHGFACDSVDGVQFVVIQFLFLDDDLVSQLKNADPLGVFKLSEIEMTRFIEISYRLQREISGALLHTAMQCEALKHELIVLLLRANERKETGILSEEQEKLVEKAIDHMHKHSNDESITIDDIAKSVGLSPSHFRKLFSCLVGSSPKRYLTLLRVQTSKSLIMQNEHSITDVALLSGFGSPQQFSKVFRQHTGLSPSEWRETRLIAG